MTRSPSPRRQDRRALRRAGSSLALAASLLGFAGPTLGPAEFPGPAAAPAPASERRTYALPPTEVAIQAANGPIRVAPRTDIDRVNWRRTSAEGTHSAGRLRGCVRLPASGNTFVSWDPASRETPNRANRRCGTASLVRTVLEVAAGHAAAHPDAPRMVVGDLSRPRGGDFGVRHGDLGDGEGHVSHQNGLDVDVYYPRSDGREHGPEQGGPDDPVRMDRELAQDLVDRFVAAGAEVVFVGTESALTGPVGVVMALRRHNDHMHVRLPRP